MWSFYRVRVTFIGFLILFNCEGRKGGIISLVPSADRIIYEMGAGENLVGVSTFSPLKGSKTIVGDLINPDYERIRSLKPDFVIITLPMQRRVKERLESMGIRTYDFSPESVEELISGILELGRMMGREDRAKELADSIERAVKKIKPLGEFYFVVIISESPVFVAGRNTYISEILELFGGKNYFSWIEGYKGVSVEDVLSGDFDVVVVPYEFSGRMGFEKKCIVKLDPNQISPGLEIFSLIDSLRSKLSVCVEKNLVRPVR